MPSIRQSFLILYTFLGLVYIALIAPPHRTAVARYLLLDADLLVLNALTPYFGAICTILGLSESY